MKMRLIASGFLSISTLVFGLALRFTLHSFLSNAFSFVLLFLFAVSVVGSMRMGVYILIKEKHEAVRSLTIAAGILGLFAGGFGLGAIVSFIAASKIKEDPVESINKTKKSDEPKKPTWHDQAKDM